MARPKILKKERSVITHSIAPVNLHSSRDHSPPMLQTNGHTDRQVDRKHTIAARYSGNVPIVIKTET